MRARFFSFLFLGGWRLIRACWHVLLSVQGSITVMLLCIITGKYSHLKACIHIHYRCDYYAAEKKKMSVSSPPKNTSHNFITFLISASKLTFQEHIHRSHFLHLMVHCCVVLSSVLTTVGLFPISPHHQVCWSKVKLNLFTFCGGDFKWEKKRKIWKSVMHALR